MNTEQSEAKSSSAEAGAVWLEEIAWDDAGLIPAIAQEHATGRTLMCAWMNREALDLSLKEGWATYWSRSRQRLWRKGEQSGHRQRIHAIRMDCDRDTLLLQVEQLGGIACHTGRPSCFFHQLRDGHWEIAAFPPETILGSLDRVLTQRKDEDPHDSYVARLHREGLDAILRKLGEECTETLLAAKAAAPKTGAAGMEELVHETADLWFHSLVMLAHLGCDSSAVLQELQRRLGVSGLEEKRSRGKANHQQPGAEAAGGAAAEIVMKPTTEERI